jgi:hypothetical protein
MGFREDNMRSILVMAAAVLMVSLASGTGFAAKQQSARSFDSCVALAKSRGYTHADREMGRDTDTPVKKFVRSCMQGKQS